MEGGIGEEAEGEEGGVIRSTEEVMRQVEIFSRKHYLQLGGGLGGWWGQKCADRGLRRAAVWGE